MKASTIDLAGFAVDPRAAEWAEFRDHYPRCPDCSRELARLGVLVGALRSEPRPVSAHVGERQLAALATASEPLRPEERASIEQHLAGCAPCRTELAVLRRFDFSALATEGRGSSRTLEALRRLGATLVPRLPLPVLAAALALFVALPAFLVWRTLSGGPVEEPRLARVEPEAAPLAPSIEPAPQPEQEPATEPQAPPRQMVELAPPREETEPAQQPPASAAPPPAPAPKTAALPEPQAPAAPPSVPAPAREAPQHPAQIAALLPSEAPRYVPGARAGEEGRRIGSTARSAGGGAPAPQVLAPSHVGRTSRESPTLYWFLPEATSLPVEVTIVDAAGVEPLLEKTLPGPSAAGIHGVDLADLGVRLAPSVDYQWFVTLVVDPAQRSNDVVSGGSVRREPAPAALATAPPERLAHAYAAAGLWYDAFDQLSTWLAAEPNAALLHAHRAALLEQVGLDEVARYERKAAQTAE